MVTLTKCEANGDCVLFHVEPQQRIAKIQRIQKIDPVALGQVRDMLIQIRKELPAYLQKQQAASLLSNPQRLAKLTPREIEEMFPRDEE